MTLRTMGCWLFVMSATDCSSSGGETGDARTDDAPDVEEECETIRCFVDFPCQSGSYCSSEIQVQPCRTFECWEVCGTRCCSGATCRTQDPIACTGDTVCWEMHQPGWGMRPRRTAECRPRPADPPPPPLDGGGDIDEDVGDEAGEDDGETADGGPYDVWLPPGSYEPASGCY